MKSKKEWGEYKKLYCLGFHIWEYKYLFKTNLMHVLVINCGTNTTDPWNFASSSKLVASDSIYLQKRKQSLFVLVDVHITCFSIYLFVLIDQYIHSFIHVDIYYERWSIKETFVVLLLESIHPSIHPSLAPFLAGI